MPRNRIPTPLRGPVAAFVLLALVVGSLLQGACLSHHSAAHAGNHTGTVAAVAAVGHSCDAEPHQHGDTRVQQPAMSAASLDLTAPDSPTVAAEAAGVAPGPEPDRRQAPSGADLLAHLCVFRI